MQIGLFFLVVVPFFIEGTGMVTNRNYFILYYLLLPFVFFIYALLTRKRLVFPVVSSVFFLLFLLFSLVSSLNFSVDKQQSFELWLFYLSAFLTYIFFYNYKELGYRTIRAVVLWGGVVFVSLYVFQLIFPGATIFKYVPNDEYNLFTPTYAFHNHLGDLIGLSMMYCLYEYLRSHKKIFLALFIAAIPFLLESFSRSAYLAFTVTLTILFIWLRKKLNSTTKNRVIFFGLITIIVVYLTSLVVVRGLDEKSHVVKITENIVASLHLPKKDILGSRPEFFYHAIRSFQQNPFFGVGPGNFIYAARQNKDKYFAWSDNAHNIFLDTLVENGIFATVFFLMFLFVILKSGLKQKMIFPVLAFFYLLLIFQTDYVYKFYSLFILFFIIAGCVIEEKNNQNLSVLYGVIAFVLLFTANIMMFNKILIKSGKYEAAQKIYPFNKEEYLPLINQAIKKEDYNTALKWAKTYRSYAPADVLAQSTLADLNIFLGEEDEGLAVYENMYQKDPFLQFPLIEKIYDLKKDRESTQEAGLFIRQVLRSYKNKLPYSYDLGKQIRDFCLKTNKSLCRQTGWMK